jgi:hypothetical protein
MNYNKSMGLKIFNYLLSMGADGNLKYRDGSTVLLLALKNKNYPKIQSLLRYPLKFNENFLHDHHNYHYHSNHNYNHDHGYPILSSGYGYGYRYRYENRNRNGNGLDPNSSDSPPHHYYHPLIEAILRNDINFVQEYCLTRIEVK